MTTQLEAAELELKLREIDRALEANPKDEALLKERLLTLAKVMQG